MQLRDGLVGANSSLHKSPWHRCRSDRHQARAAGTVYIGNRGDSTVCALDERTFVKGACGKLDSMPDGILYVAKTREVWVTTPRDKSIRIPADPATHRVYAGGAKAGSLAIATLTPTGTLTAHATVKTAEGARNGVVASDGELYLAHGQNSELVVVAPNPR